MSGRLRPHFQINKKNNFYRYRSYFFYCSFDYNRNNQSIWYWSVKCLREENKLMLVILCW